MKYIILLLALSSCGGDEVMPNTFNTIPESPAMRECRNMKTLWQIECLCIPEGCMSKHYACFWDMSHYGLGEHPEMEGLYNVFHNEMLDCHYLSQKADDIVSCEDEVLRRALERCEAKLLGL